MANVERDVTLTSQQVNNSDRYPATSRYKSARYFQRNIPGVGMFVEPETWTPPAIKPSPNDYFTLVGSGEAGRLDLVAARVYRMEQLWWVIAYVNNIIDPFTEVVAGMTLRYPRFSDVVSKVLG